MTERAHDLAAAERFYRSADSEELLNVARGLAQDAKTAFQFEVTHFCIERLVLITSILRDRERILAARARRYELLIEKLKRPPEAQAPEVRLVKEDK